MHGWPGDFKMQIDGYATHRDSELVGMGSVHESEFFFFLK